MPSIFKIGVIASILSTASALVGTGGSSTGASPTGPWANNTISSTLSHAPTTTTMISYTTSTVCTTVTETIDGHVVTKTIPLYTTICPVSQYTGVPALPPKTYITSTITVTDIYTIPNGDLTTDIYLTTTVCPYTSTPAYDTTILITHTVNPTAPYYPIPTFSTIPKPGNGTAPCASGTGVGVVYPPAPTPIYEAPVYPVPIGGEDHPTTIPYENPGALTSVVEKPTHTPVTIVTPPLAYEGAASARTGVSSILALVVAGGFALLY